MALKYFTKDFYIDALNNLIFKGSGKVKLTGSSYVVTKDKILILSLTGEVLAQYDIEDEFVATPPTLTSAGTPGQKAWDGTFLYYCVAATLWIKVFALSADIDIMEIYVAPPPAYNSPGNKGEVAIDFDNGLKYEYIGTQWVRYPFTKVW